MNSDQKPDKWGYGLTWLITAGLVVMVAIGVVKLRKTAIDSSAKLKKAKAEAMATAKKLYEEETKATEALETADKKVAEEKAKQLALAANPPASAEDIAMGKTIYATCAACHGPEGSGSLNPMAIKAPNLAGMPAWYATTQIKNMKNDIRGGAGDMEAMMMKPMVMNLSDKQIDQVSAYLESLKPVTPKHTLKGDAG